MRKLKKVPYDFFEVLEDFNVSSKNEKTGKDEIAFSLLKGEVVLRVGEGIATKDLPISTINTLGYRYLLENKYIALINDEIEKRQFAKIYENVIKEVELEVTSRYLSFISTYEGFIKNIK